MNSHIPKQLTPDIVKEYAHAIGEALGVDWNRISLDQFTKGLAVELEHGTRNPITNVTNDDPLATGKIALAHLHEMDDYYTRLDEMENGK